MTLRADVYLESPDLVLGRTIQSVPSLSLEVEPQATADVLFVSVRIPSEECGQFETFERLLEEDPAVGGFEMALAEGTERIYAVDTDVDRPLLSEVAAEMGINLVRTYSREGDAGWTFELELADRDALLEFRSFMDRLDISFELRRLFSQRPSEDGGFGLSQIQRETLVTAFENGYFDVPRRMSQNELADVLGASPTAVSQRLRRATAALVERTIATENSE